MYAQFTRILWGLAVVAGLAALSFANDQGITKTAPSKTMHFRASTLEDMRVRNAAGDDLGRIKDLVVDMNTGKIAYAALDSGGFFGFGDKLFAVPWNELKYQITNNERHLVLNVSKENLKNAPGFDWPDTANPEWAANIGKFYGEHRLTGERTK